MRNAIRLVMVCVLGLALGCGGRSGGGGSQVEPDPDLPGLPPIPERPTSQSVLVDETGIRTVFDEAGATITVPVTTLSGVGNQATLTLALTTLRSLEGPTGETTFTLAEGTQEIVVNLPEATPPETQGGQADRVIRYVATVGKSEAFGVRSLYMTLPKWELRLWAPVRMDAGAVTAVRAWIRDLDTGALRSDVDIQIGDQVVPTDETGQAAFEITAVDDQALLTIEAKAVIDGVTVAAVRIVEVIPEGAPSVFVSTDKPLYRPGQTIHIRVLALAASDKTPLADELVVIEVLDGKENKIFREETATDTYGIASLTAPLASQVNLGDYVIRATVGLDGAMEAERVVEVTEETLPKFDVRVIPDSAYFAPHEAISGVVSARYFFGKAVVGGAVTVTAVPSSGGDKEAIFTGTTDADGVLAFQFSDGSSGNLDLTVEVVDTAGFSVKKDAGVVVTDPELNVSLTPESPVILEDTTALAYVRTTGPLGGPVQADCILQSSGKTSFVTGADGFAIIEVATPLFVVICETEDGLSGQASEQMDWISAEEGGLVVRASRSVLEPGEPVEITVLAPGASGTVYLDRVHRGRIVDTVDVPISDGSGQITVEPSSDETGLLIFTGYLFGAEGGVVNAERIVYVRPAAAEVTVETDAQSYLPGTEATLTFKVTDPAGEGRAAAVGVTIADEAVFALAGSVGPDQVKAHFLLDDAPLGIRSFVLSGDVEEIQVRAGASLAAVGEQFPASMSPSTLLAIQSEAYSIINQALWDALDLVRADLQESVEAGDLTAENATETLAALEVSDYWGRPFTIDSEIYDYDWRGSVEVRLTLRSTGLDELADTWDDWAQVLWITLDHGDPASMSEPGDMPSGDYDYESVQDSASSPPDYNDEDGVPEPGPESSPVKKRDDFPETLYVNPAVITDQTGTAQVTIPLADNITEWRVSMITNTADGLVGGGLGGITVFQDFFLDMDLPSKLTQGDRIDLPIGVYNFSDETQEVTISVPGASWFDHLGQDTSTVTIPAGESVAAPFSVLVTEAGTHLLEASATTATFGDAVVRTARVVPDGERFDLSQSGPLEGSTILTATFPETAIEGGNDLLLKLMGGPSAQLVDGMDALVKVPTGCFEPMMNATWINALVGSYLKYTGGEEDPLAHTAAANLDNGLQQCLTFECTGGGYTWFGDPDPAHPILTSFALVMFADISELRYVDEAMLERARGMLTGAQGDGGEWTTNQGTKEGALPWDELRSTCIALWGLAVSGGDSTVNAQGAAVAFIKSSLALDADTYTLGMCANALVTAAPDDLDTDAVFAELLDRVEEEGELAWWTSAYSGFTHASGEVIDVETTALVSQALYGMATPPTVVEGALKWLSGKKSPGGLFLSTQGTIQAMRAFMLAAKAGSVDTDVDLTVTVGEDEVYTTHVDASNKDVVQMVSLSPYATPGQVPIYLTYEGTGKLFWQLESTHYLPWPEDAGGGALMNIVVTYDPEVLTVDGSTTATLTVTNAGNGKSDSDMPMVEYAIPPGFDVDFDPLDKQVETEPNVARYDLKDDRVLIYLHHMPAEPGDSLSFQFPLRPRFPMEITTPPSKTYPYYEPELGSVSPPVKLVVSAE